MAFIVFKEAASKTNDVAGDGTTTATVLSEAIFREGLNVLQPPTADTPTALIFFDGGEEADQYWLGLKNFYVISRYNPRSKYAMAVYHLSQEIKDRS